eukprot:g4533.t1
MSGSRARVPKECTKGVVMTKDTYFLSGSSLNDLEDQFELQKEKIVGYGKDLRAGASVVHKHHSHKSKWEAKDWDGKAAYDDEDALVADEKKGEELERAMSLLVRRSENENGEEEDKEPLYWYTAVDGNGKQIEKKCREDWSILRKDEKSTLMYRSDWSGVCSYQFLKEGQTSSENLQRYSGSKKVKKRLDRGEQVAGQHRKRQKKDRQKTGFAYTAPSPQPPPYAPGLCQQQQQQQQFPPSQQFSHHPPSYYQQPQHVVHRDSEHRRDGFVHTAPPRPPPLPEHRRDGFAHTAPPRPPPLPPQPPPLPEQRRVGWNPQNNMRRSRKRMNAMQSLQKEGNRRGRDNRYEYERHQSYPKQERYEAEHYSGDQGHCHQQRRNSNYYESNHHDFSKARWPEQQQRQQVQLGYQQRVNYRNFRNTQNKQNPRWR